MDAKETEIEVLEKARDKFRDQALDLKQELKWLKKRKSDSRSKSRNKVQICSTVGDENSTLAPVSKFEQLKIK